LFDRNPKGNLLNDNFFHSTAQNFRLALHHNSKVFSNISDLGGQSVKMQSESAFYTEEAVKRSKGFCAAIKIA
jgi:hypothetical protein